MRQDSGAAGAVIWVTGLSAAGKTTLATAIVRQLRDEGEVAVLLDGDDLREAFGATAGHDRDTRLVLGFQYARLARCCRPLSPTTRLM